MTDCPFCKGYTPILENEKCILIKDKYPVTEGHALIIPKRHYESYFSSTREELDAITDLIIKAKEFLDKRYNPDGYNIGINSGEASGQTVMHTHIHVIPRYDGDVDDPSGGVRGVIPSKQKY